jgi:hypothetical protein
VDDMARRISRRIDNSKKQGLLGRVACVGLTGGATARSA